ncbi:unnamed protein product [Xylocopa violacea]|uniref:Uncharacterized protein n=1 Tax=Xylocopa violacea TaxID=135666 RepID=A0ABP1NXQ0_XYLVO
MRYNISKSRLPRQTNGVRRRGASGARGREEIPGIEARVFAAADFDDPLSEISSTITHVRSLSSGNVISDPTKLGSSFMRAPAAREYSTRWVLLAVAANGGPGEIAGRSKEECNAVRGFVDMVGIREKYSVGFAWKPRNGVPHAGTRLPINKHRHFARDSRVLSSHSERRRGRATSDPADRIDAPYLRTAAAVESSFMGKRKQGNPFGNYASARVRCRCQEGRTRSV